jgi:hypothetical protein
MVVRQQIILLRWEYVEGYLLQIVLNMLLQHCLQMERPLVLLSQISWTQLGTLEMMLRCCSSQTVTLVGSFAVT